MSVPKVDQAELTAMSQSDMLDYTIGLQAVAKGPKPPRVLKRTINDVSTVATKKALPAVAAAAATALDDLNANPQKQP